MLGCWWTESSRAEYLARDAGPLGRRRKDECSWDLECESCAAPMRLLFGVSEWGKMNTYFADIHTVVELVEP